MRVIAGSAKGTRLFAPVKSSLRPTTDRAKQVLFDTLQSISPHSEVVVDIFAGTGSLGIEALSRGAREALFVENSTKALRYLDKNLLQTHLQSKAKVFMTDAFVFLNKHKNANFVLVFADPPYGGDYSSKLLDFLSQSTFLSVGGLLVLEESVHFQPKLSDNFVLLREKRVGDTKLFFIEKRD